VVAKHPDKKAIAVGHVRRKLLHLAFAIWKTNTPFDEKHYAWHAPAQPPTSGVALAPRAEENDPAAGLKNPAQQVSKEVTAAGSITSTPSIPQTPAVDEHTFVDFTHLKRQLTIGPGRRAAAARNAAGLPDPSRRWSWSHLQRAPATKRVSLL
jgi:hypothetical protein